MYALCMQNKINLISKQSVSMLENTNDLNAKTCFIFRQKI